MLKQLYDRIRLNLSLYPGIVEYRCAECLEAWYGARRARLGWLKIALNAVVWLVATTYFRSRTRSVARHWGFDESWVAMARKLACEGFVHPNDLALYDITEAGALRHHVRRFEHVAISRAIANPATDHHPLVTDKLAFAHFCESHGLPTPATIAIVRDGKIETSNLPVPAWMILKPVDGSGGKGVTAITDFSEIARLAPRGTWLAQQHILPHPDMVPLALDALPTMRLTTILNEQSEPEIVTAVLRFPAREEVVVDNVHAGGLVAAVDLATGMLSTARAGNGPGEYDKHPLSGAPIKGRVLPDWKAAKDLVLHVHGRLLPNHVQIGWDVALSDSGPVLIEANARPNVRPAQRAMRCGIGQTRHGELLSYHLQRSIADPARKRFL